MAAQHEALRQPYLFSGRPHEEIREAVLRMLPDHEKGTNEEPESESQETIEVAGIRSVQPKDYYRILQWFSDPETQGHLDPLPKLPANWGDENQVMESVLDLGKYYDNQGEAEKITALAAVNEKDKILGVSTIRWRGDPWVPEGHKIASIERVIVNPKIRGKEIGRHLMHEAHKTVFGRGFNEVRVWVFVDDKAGPDKGGRNLHFFHNILGYDILRGENYSWKDYAKKRGLGENVENREAFWLSLKLENWESREPHQVLIFPDGQPQLKKA